MVFSFRRARGRSAEGDGNSPVSGAGIRTALAHHHLTLTILCYKEVFPGRHWRVRVRGAVGNFGKQAGEAETAADAIRI